MDDSRREVPNRGVPPGAPRWVKVSGAIVVVLVLVVIAVLIIGGGEHGPGRHGAHGAETPGVTGLASSAGVLG